MGYITAQKLIEKYGSPVGATVAYLKGTLDEDERKCVENRINSSHVVMAKLILLEEKMDLMYSSLVQLIARTK